MTNVGIPADWYPDPEAPGGLRYWDGVAWTPHRVPPPVAYYPPAGGQGAPPGWGTPPGWGVSTWKGADLGRPASGPGALADPATRLGARVLDILLMVPVFAVLVLIALAIFASRFGPVFPRIQTNNSGPVPVPGFVWLYLTIFVCGIVTSLVMVAYQTVAVAHFGRTLGMSWLHIRPLRTSGVALGWGRAFARAAIFFVADFLGWFGLFDPLWCLWDKDRQCLHDKVADSIVVTDARH